MKAKYGLIGTSLVLLVAGGTYAYSKKHTPEGLPSCYADLVCADPHIISSAQQDRLKEYHQALLERYNIDLRVMTVPVDAETITRIFQAADIGGLSSQRTGVLFAIDAPNNQVRLEISAGLDAVYTDGFVAYIQQRQMVPFFQANRVADGVLATTEMLVTRAQQAEAKQEFIPPEQLPQNLAIGAGAQTNVTIGEGYKPDIKAATTQSITTKNDSGPLDIVKAYHQVLADGLNAPDLEIYSQATRIMRQKWVVTPAQMRNELQTYQSCDVDKTVFIKDKPLAVVRYKVDQRKCAPYFLVNEGGAWRLDFVTMMNNIRFNIDNDWHLDMQKSLPYVDAFDDWTFNKDGYPFPMPKLRWGLTVNTNYRAGVTSITHIYPDAPASAMPFAVGDIILSWCGKVHPDYKFVINSMDDLDSGEAFHVDIQRGNLRIPLDLTAPPRLNNK